MKTSDIFADGQLLAAARLRAPAVFMVFGVLLRKWGYKGEAADGGKGMAGRG